jgi:hypothetical protein
MLDVQIDEGYRVTSDKLNFILLEKQKPKRKDSKPNWRAIGFFGRFEHLAERYMELKGKSMSLECKMCIKDLVDKTQAQHEKDLKALQSIFIDHPLSKYSSDDKSAEKSQEHISNDEIRDEKYLDLQVEEF